MSMAQEFKDFALKGNVMDLAVGVIIGFPVCSSIGMRTVPAAHGAIVVGVLPLALASVTL